MSLCSPSSASCTPYYTICEVFIEQVLHVPREHNKVRCWHCLSRTRMALTTMLELLIVKGQSGSILCFPVGDQWRAPETCWQGISLGGQAMGIDKKIHDLNRLEPSLHSGISRILYLTGEARFKETKVPKPSRLPI